MAGFTIGGKQNVKSNVCDPYRNHRWLLTHLVGESEAEHGSTFVYARNIEIPDHIPNSHPKGRLKLFFYDVPLYERMDVLEDLIAISQGAGETRVERTNGLGKKSGGWRFINSSVSKLIMPKTDYRMSELAIVEVHVEFKIGEYRAVLPPIAE